jgi:putative nucleotidyltransferase with HDIG domain
VSVPSHAVPIYIGAVLLSAVGLAVLAWRVHPLQYGRPDNDSITLAVLCMLGFLGSASAERNVGQRIGFSFTSIILLTAVALAGPFGAAVVGAVTYLLTITPTKLQVRIFNSGMTAAYGAIGGFVYLLAGGVTKIGEVQGVWSLLLRVGLPLIVADIAQCLGNAIILAGIMRLTKGTPMRRFILGMLGSSGPAYIGYGLIGFLFVILWVPAGVGPASALLILAPLFVARWAFVQYGDEQRAHERTLSALVAAVETKEMYTGGHSERVASLCDLMAGALSLSHQDTESLRFAGILHDIGKLAIPTRVLHPAERPSEADLVSIATHAARGVEMVSDIDFLSDSTDAILHHHERMDGRGYPAGLSGEEIPLLARIIAVADAFDSLTTPKVHREVLTVEEALEELRRRAGTQFDPSVVSALGRSLVRHPWEPARQEPAKSATARTAFDHDDPGASDLMAGFASARRRPTAGQSTPSHPAPSHATPSHATPSHATPTHATPSHATPTRATPNLVDPTTETSHSTDAADLRAAEVVVPVVGFVETETTSALPDPEKSR